MFFSSLASANELTTSRVSKAKPEDGNGEEFDEESANLPRDTGLPILYSRENNSFPREVLIAFLRDVSGRLMDDNVLTAMIFSAQKSGTALNVAATELQRNCLEYVHQVERDFGCNYLSQVSSLFPEDSELLNEMTNFMYTCLRSFIQALRIRSRLYKKKRLSGPDPHGQMSRTAISEFFEAVSAHMQQPDVKEELRSIFEKTGKVPNERVVEMQRNLIKLIGYDADAGVATLNKIGTLYADDRELLMKMQYFVGSAELACHESTMTPQQKEAFYSEIPLMMRPFPHIFFVKKRMAEQQAAGASRDMEREALRRSGILELISSPDGRARLQSLATRIQESKLRMEKLVADWDKERRSQEFESFLEHPLMAPTDTDDTPVQRVMKFVDMSDDELDKALANLIIVSENSEILQNATTGEDGSKGTAMAGLLSALGTLSNMGQGGGARPAHQHQRAHHQHGPNCQHGQCGAPKPAGPNVASGAAPVMDR